MRRRSISHRLDPGSHAPPAFRKMVSSSRGARTATINPNWLNSAGPTLAGRAGGAFIGEILAQPGPAVED
jgi:hypothetical protein